MAAGARFVTGARVRQANGFVNAGCLLVDGCVIHSVLHSVDGLELLGPNKEDEPPEPPNPKAASGKDMKMAGQNDARLKTAGRMQI